MALADVFSPKIHNVHYSQVIGGLIKFEGDFYSPQKKETRILEGTKVKLTVLPSNSTINGKKAIFVKGETWLQI